MLPSVPITPRTKCMPSRLLRSGSSGFRMNIGSTKKKPTNERKNRISMVGMCVPTCLTSIAMTTSVSEPTDTSAAPRALRSRAFQRASNWL